MWACLGEASGKPVATVMTSWTKQMGYPVLTVDTKHVRLHTLLRTEVDRQTTNIYLCKLSTRRLYYSSLYGHLEEVPEISNSVF